MAGLDTLKLARASRDKRGFAQEAAEATAEAFNNALGGLQSTDLIRGAEVATKRAVADLGRDLRSELQIALRDLKLWTGSVITAGIAFLGGLMTLFDFIGPPHESGIQRRPVAWASRRG